MIIFHLPPKIFKIVCLPEISMTRLQDKMAVIMGGSSGMGLETAKLFASEGTKAFLANWCLVWRAN